MKAAQHHVANATRVDLGVREEFELRWKGLSPGCGLPAVPTAAGRSRLGQRNEVKHAKKRCPTSSYGL